MNINQEGMKSIEQIEQTHKECLQELEELREASNLAPKVYVKRYNDIFNKIEALDKSLGDAEKPLEEGDFVSIRYDSEIMQDAPFNTLPCDLNDELKMKIFRLVVSCGFLPKRKHTESLRFLFVLSAGAGLQKSDFAKYTLEKLRFADLLINSSEIEVKAGIRKMKISDALKKDILDAFQVTEFDLMHLEEVEQIQRLSNCYTAGELACMWDAELMRWADKSITDRYCLIGEILRTLKIFPYKYGEGVWEESSRKAKYDAVKDWIRAYERK